MGDISSVFSSEMDTNSVYPNISIMDLAQDFDCTTNVHPHISTDLSRDFDTISIDSHMSSNLSSEVDTPSESPHISMDLSQDFDTISIDSQISNDHSSEVCAPGLFPQISMDPSSLVSTTSVLTPMNKPYLTDSSGHQDPPSPLSALRPKLICSGPTLSSNNSCPVLISSTQTESVSVVCEYTNVMPNSDKHVVQDHAAGQCAAGQCAEEQCAAGQWGSHIEKLVVPMSLFKNTTELCQSFTMAYNDVNNSSYPDTGSLAHPLLAPDTVSLGYPDTGSLGYPDTGSLAPPLSAPDIAQQVQQLAVGMPPQYTLFSPTVSLTREDFSQNMVNRSLKLAGASLLSSLKLRKYSPEFDKSVATARLSTPALIKLGLEQDRFASLKLKKLNSLKEKATQVLLVRLEKLETLQLDEQNIGETAILLQKVCIHSFIF